MIRLLSVLCILTFFPVSANAQVNDEGAKILKNFVQGLLDYQKHTGEAFGSVDVKYVGDIKVEQMADYYAVAFPQIILGAGESFANTGEDVSNFEVDLGVILMSVAPDSENGYWKGMIQFPDSIILKDGGEEQFVIKIGDQNSVALLSEKLGYFTKLNINFSDISFEGADEELGFSLGGIQFFQNLEEEEDGSFSGPYALALKNMRINPPVEGEYMVAEELKLDGELTKVVLPTLKEYEKKVMGFLDAMNAIEESHDASESEMSDEDILASVMDMYDFDWDGVSGRYSVKNFKFSSLDESESLSLDEASFGMAVSGLRSDAGAIQIDMAYDGLDMKGAEYESVNVYAPKEMELNIQLDHVPYTSLSEMAQTSVQSVIANPEMAQMVGMGLMLRVPSLLTQSGTKAVVTGKGINGDVYNVVMDGNAMADIKAIMGFTAKFKTVFEGLDTVLSALKADEANSDFSEVIGELERFKEVGVQESGPNGKPAYAYTFEVTPEGEMLLNGQDAASVMP